MVQSAGSCPDIPDLLRIRLTEVKSDGDMKGEAKGGSVSRRHQGRAQAAEAEADV